MYILRSLILGLMKLNGYTAATAFLSNITVTQFLTIFPKKKRTQSDPEILPSVKGVGHNVLKSSVSAEAQ